MTIIESITRIGCCEISSGTLRPQDLIPRYLDALRELAPAAYEQVTMPACGFSAFPSYAAENTDHDWWRSEDCDALLESLCEALQEHAPEGFVFGAHEGDGASMGFWAAHDES